MKQISPFILEQSMTYAEYWQLIRTEFEAGRTTGPHQSEAMLNYTKLNIARMKRLDKTTKLTASTLDKITKIKQPTTWLVLTEAWCGDAAQIIPILNKMAEENEYITLRFLLRDENLELMDAFLTNGSRSIPKIIILDTASRTVVNTWGPRPAELQAMVMNAKAQAEATTDGLARKTIWDEAKKYTQLWYAKDKTQGIQQEFVEVL